MKQAYADRYCELLQDFSNEALDARIDSLANLIRPHVYEDTKKFYPNNQFEQNLEQDITQTSPQGPFVIAGLKPFITARREALLAQLAAYGCSVSALETVAENTGIVISPNPSAGRFFIENPGEAIMKMELLNLQGRRVQTWETGLDFGLLEGSLAEMPAGVYFLKMESKTGRVFMHRLVVI